MSKEPSVEDKLRKMELRRLRVQNYYPKILLGGGLLIFGLLLILNFISNTANSTALLGLIAGLILIPVGAFIARRAYRAMNTNAAVDVKKANMEAQSWYR